MIRYLFLLLFLLSSCSTVNSKKNDNKNIIFSNEMSFEEFKIKLDEYIKENPYPNMDG